MDTLDTRRWLLMQAAEPVAIAIAEELWVTRSPQVPGYNWDDSEPAQSERWDPCMSLQCSAVVCHDSHCGTGCSGSGP